MKTLLFLLLIVWAASATLIRSDASNRVLAADAETVSAEDLTDRKIVIKNHAGNYLLSARNTWTVGVWGANSGQGVSEYWIVKKTDNNGGGFGLRSVSIGRYVRGGGNFQLTDDVRDWSVFDIAERDGSYTFKLKLSNRYLAINSNGQMYEDGNENSQDILFSVEFKDEEERKALRERQERQAKENAARQEKLAAEQKARAEEQAAITKQLQTSLQAQQKAQADLQREHDDQVRAREESKKTVATMITTAHSKLADDIENLRARIRATQEEEKAKEVAREMKRKQIEEARRSRQSADEAQKKEAEKKAKQEAAEREEQARRLEEERARKNAELEADRLRQQKADDEAKAVALKKEQEEHEKQAKLAEETKIQQQKKLELEKAAKEKEEAEIAEKRRKEEELAREKVKQAEEERKQAAEEAEKAKKEEEERRKKEEEERKKQAAEAEAKRQQEAERSNPQLLKTAKSTADAITHAAAPASAASSTAAASGAAAASPASAAAAATAGGAPVVPGVPSAAASIPLPAAAAAVQPNAAPLAMALASAAAASGAAGGPSCETEPPRPPNIEEMYPVMPQLKGPRVVPDPGAGEEMSGLTAGPRQPKLPDLGPKLATDNKVLNKAFSSLKSAVQKHADFLEDNKKICGKKICSSTSSEDE